MLELYKSKLLQKGISQTLLKGNSLLVNRASNTICQKCLKSDINNIKNDSKVITLSPLNNVSTKRELSTIQDDNIIGKKNKEMWKEFKAIDPRVIRPVDGTEFFVTNYFINLTDVFPRISKEEFIKRAEENLSKLEIFNLAFKRINGHLFFIHKPFKMHLEEVEYNEDEEIENFLKKKDKMVIPFKPLPDEEEKDVQYLYYFKICQLKKSNQTKITLTINHTICDGRTIFTLMDYIRKFIKGESIERNNEPLPNFGGMERFKKLDKSFYESPKVWNEVTKVPLVPHMKPPFHNIRPHMIFDYQPISKFMHENGITVQAMLMAVISRAARRYNNLPKDTPIWNTTPFDVRASPYATEEFKKRKFYSNVGIMQIKLIGQNTLMEDLKHCMVQLQKAKNSNDDIRQIVCCSNTLDPKTLKFIPKAGFPDMSQHSIVYSSNIGKINGNIPLLTSTNHPFFFMFNLSSYHTNDKLFITLLRPVNFDERYVKIITEEINKIFIPKNISKY